MDSLFLVHPVGMNPMRVPFLIYDNSYYAELAAKVAPYSLLRPIVSKHPFQPPMPQMHPAMLADYELRRREKGAYIFISQARGDEAVMLRHFRRNAVARNKELRWHRRLREEKFRAKDFAERMVLAEDLRRTRRFTYAAEHARERRRVFWALIAAAFHRREKTSDEILRVRIERIVQTHKHYWQEVRKNLQKKPRSLALSGSNISAFLAELPHQKNKGKVILAIRRIKKNVEEDHAVQMLEHSSGISMSTPVWNKFVTHFHRPTFEKELRKKKKDQAYKKTLKILKESAKARGEKYVRRRKEIIPKVEKRIKAYWLEVDKRRHKLIRPASLIRTNQQSVLNELRYRAVLPTIWDHAQVKKNRIIARAAQLSEHAEHPIPEIFAYRSTHYDHFDDDNKRRIKHLKAYDRQVWEEHLKSNQQRKDYAKKIRMERLRRTDDSIVVYWKAFDHHNKKIKHTMSFSTDNVNEAARMQMGDRPSRMLYAKAEADKKAKAWHAGYSVNEPPHERPKLVSKPKSAPKAKNRED